MLHIDPSKRKWMAVISVCLVAVGFWEEFCSNIAIITVVSSFAANIKLKPTVPGFPVYRGPIHCFRTVLQKEGIAGIYRGAGAMLLRDVPGYCLYFIPYTYFCGWITPDGCISPNPSSIWLAGGIAGKHPFFLPTLAKPGQEGSQGRLWGWLSGHRILLVTRRGHRAEQPSSPGPGPLAPRLRFMTWQTLWKSCYQTFIGLNVSKKENSPHLHLPGCLMAAHVSHCQWYTAAKMPPEEDFTLLASHQEGVHHTQQKQSWLLLSFSFFSPCVHLPVRPACASPTTLTCVRSPLHPLPISGPFLNCRPLNADQSLAQVMITKCTLCFSCK